MPTATGIPLSMRTFVMAALLPLAFPLSANDGQNAYRLLTLDGYKVKWGEQTLGVRASISYAFADETLRFEEARNCGVLVPMTVLSGQHLSMETLTQETAAAFRVWERAANLSFHQVEDAREADIVLGAQGQPRGRAFANVTYGPGLKEGVRGIDQALVCLNLDHPRPSGQLMGFRYTEAFAELQPGDLDGVRSPVWLALPATSLYHRNPATTMPIRHNWPLWAQT